MQGRIRFILLIVLFILAGNLCRQQAVSRTTRHFSYTLGSLFQQHPDQDNGRYRLDHSMIAPEVTVCMQAPCTYHKYFTRNQPLPAYSVPVKPAVSEIVYRNSVDLHPHTVDYYIFSLGKIVI